MSLNPLLNMLNILLTILQILVHILRVAVQQINFRRTTGVNWHRPGSVLDAGCQVARKGIGFGGGEIHVFGAGRGVVGIEGVHGLDLASVCFHTASCLTFKGVNDVSWGKR
jgi:hypothetical protein